MLRRLSLLAAAVWIRAVLLTPEARQRRLAARMLHADETAARIARSEWRWNHALHAARPPGDGERG